MKTFLFLLALLTVGTLRAQPRVISSDDYKKAGQNLAELSKNYPGKLVGVTQDQLGESLRAEVKKLVEAKELSNLIISLEVYFNESGKIDWVIYQVVADKEDRGAVQELLDTQLAGKLQGWQINGTQGKKFSFMTLVRMGNPPIIRTERTGDSLISSLDEACTTLDTLGIKALHFHQLKLTEVPYAIIYRFPNLELLDLHSNQLTTLNLDVAKLPKLTQIDLHANQLRSETIRLTTNRTIKILNLHSNALTDIPEAVRSCKRLENLWMGGNKELVLTSSSFRHLRTLTELNLYGCALSTLPNGIRKLRRLQVLDLYYNEFAQLPSAITRLKRLNQLAISNNQLVGLPERIDRLRRLQVLYAHHNRLSKLPERMAKLQRLQLLDIGYNWYRTFPEVVGSLSVLRELDISGNELAAFPVLLSEMPTLEKLHLRGNPFLRKEGESVYLPLIKKVEQNPAEVYY